MQLMTLVRTERIFGLARTGPALLLALASLCDASVARAAEACPQNFNPNQVVYPTGSYPTDILNVRAAVAQGGKVLLKATDVNGVPTAFEFSSPTPTVGRSVVLLSDFRQSTSTSRREPRSSVTGLRAPLAMMFEGMARPSHASSEARRATTPTAHSPRMTFEV
jgi:hypothetical protein